MTTIDLADRKAIRPSEVPFTIYRKGRKFPEISGRVETSRFWSKLSGDRELIIEAYFQTYLVRKRLSPPSKSGAPFRLELTGFPIDCDSQLRVKVVSKDQSHFGKLLIYKDRLRPEEGDDTEKKSENFFPTYYEPLGQEVWKIRFDDSTDEPALVLNSDIKNVRAHFINSKTFQSSILSEMVRDVLTHTFIVKKHEPEVEATGWLGDWMKFIGKLRIPNVIDENPDLSYDEDEEEYIEKVSAYIESIVRKFALRCGLATRFESEVGK